MKITKVLCPHIYKPKGKRDWGWSNNGVGVAQFSNHVCSICGDERIMNIKGTDKSI